jgi:hypothetical protein
LLPPQPPLAPKAAEALLFGKKVAMNIKINIASEKKYLILFDLAKSFIFMITFIINTFKNDGNTLMGFYALLFRPGFTLSFLLLAI